MRKVIALDFDGLICDGLNECILVTWNGYYGKDLSAFSDRGLASIPVEFVERFKHCRNFVKHLGHFIVPLVDSTTPIVSQDDFQAIYAAIAPEAVERFMKKATEYRHWSRQEKPAEWLRHHSLYPGMKRFLSQTDLSMTYIVTAKDSKSVREILSSAGIKFDESRIFGEQKLKIAALQQITDLEKIPPYCLHFFDDNVLNVVEAQKAGYSSYWATWGYNAPHHFHIAQESSISSISLTEFLEDRMEPLHNRHLQNSIF
ncbi:MAG: hypothetical protein N4J56_007022 [Chroococcidiopsis sp. SAG 2025]|uniref:HAD family hydrolase n=1 Tax=Chroococcidiopsis sp. SAG 2025 TaxID=171389 RepID=UPI002936E1AD|nr:hypothetical protein [Chroococcidiopsis sp. SAG 2025]MDV2997317.1 hypothetical protein [Chroococcidiopsis sp. SAG 2025]